MYSAFGRPPIVKRPPPSGKTPGAPDGRSVIGERQEDRGSFMQTALFAAESHDFDQTMLKERYRGELAAGASLSGNYGMPLKTAAIHGLSVC